MVDGGSCFYFDYDRRSSGGSSAMVAAANTVAATSIPQERMNRRQSLEKAGQALIDKCISLRAAAVDVNGDANGDEDIDDDDVYIVAEEADEQIQSDDEQQQQQQQQRKKELRSQHRRSKRNSRSGRKQRYNGNDIKSPSTSRRRKQHDGSSRRSRRSMASPYAQSDTLIDNDIIHQVAHLDLDSSSFAEMDLDHLVDASCRTTRTISTTARAVRTVLPLHDYEHDNSNNNNTSSSNNNHPSVIPEEEDEPSFSMEDLKEYVWGALPPDIQKQVPEHMWEQIFAEDPHREVVFSNNDDDASILSDITGLTEAFPPIAHLEYASVSTSIAKRRRSKPVKPAILTPITAAYINTATTSTSTSTTRIRTITKKRASLDHTTTSEVTGTTADLSYNEDSTKGMPSFRSLRDPSTLGPVLEVDDIASISSTPSNTNNIVSATTTTITNNNNNNSMSNHSATLRQSNTTAILPNDTAPAVNRISLLSQDDTQVTIPITNTEKRPTTVRFSTVQIRFYTRTISDHPGVFDGPAIGIDWQYRSGGTMEIAEWEYHRTKTLSPSMLLSRKERETILTNLGFHQRDIAQSTRSIIKTKHQRKQTAQNLHAMAMEEAIESATRKMKRVLTFGLVKK